MVSFSNDDSEVCEMIVFCEVCFLDNCGTNNLVSFILTMSCCGWVGGADDDECIRCSLGRISGSDNNALGGVKGNKGGVCVVFLLMIILLSLFRK